MNGRRRASRREFALLTAAAGFDLPFRLNAAEPQQAPLGIRRAGFHSTGGGRILIKTPVPAPNRTHHFASVSVM